MILKLIAYGLRSPLCKEKRTCGLLALPFSVFVLYPHEFKAGLDNIIHTNNKIPNGVFPKWNSKLLQ
jgi:hypothetical protein